ncbi:hypothetical protein VTJ83DRAFT_6162 [Remersonia thermophila]|uniref:Uncharacterized protein n=1 Tax=Remersonia thermophila TaxID=72144 RepID=A0ABR4D922_9PEZI
MPPSNRPLSLPSIPDIAFEEYDGKTHLLPELGEVVSAATGASGTTLEDDDAAAAGAAVDNGHSPPSRSHSSQTHRSVRRRRMAALRRAPSVSSTNTLLTYTPTLHCFSHPGHDPACDVPPVQLVASQTPVLESWTIVYHHARPRTTRQLRLCGVTLWRQIERDDGSVLSVLPNPHFSQPELAATIAMHQASVAAHAARLRGGSSTHKRRRLLCKAPVTDPTKQPPPHQLQHRQSFVGGSVAAIPAGSDWAVYAADLEARLRALDWAVQDEIYELLNDRLQSSSTAFRRREWRVVAMSQIPGGELTDAPTGFGYGNNGGGKDGERLRKWFASWRWRETAPEKLACGPAEMPVTEYRLILRGSETRVDDQGWPHYNRYSRPWRAADDKETGDLRRWPTTIGRRDKYVDF